MPKHDPSERTKREIIKTAAKLSEEKGWDKVSIDDIVTEVGVTRGAFYHYFKSREDLIFSVMAHSMAANNPYETVSEKKELNALEKLRLMMKMAFKVQLDTAMKSNYHNTMLDPLVFKSNICFSIYVQAPSVEKLIIEGNKDGSMSVRYPIHTAHAFILICDEWSNPMVFELSQKEYSERLLFLEQFCQQLGLPILDDELKDMLLQHYKCITGLHN